MEGGRGEILFSEAAELDDSPHGLQETDCLVVTGVVKGDTVYCCDDIIWLQSTITADIEGEREG